MNHVLTFIIPVRHQENATSWPQLKQQLAETMASIARQTIPRWKAVIVANEGAELPELPINFVVRRVDFPPNPMHEQGANSKEDFYNAVRFDKGRRVLAGMLYAGATRHFMIVDNDDFVSRRLAAFVATHPNENGWYIHSGYIWSGGNLLYRHFDFSHTCGSSHIVRADLYCLPARLEDANDSYIRRILGSHIFIEEYLHAKGASLAPLPFVGAVYRTGHLGAHSRSETILEKYFRLKEVWQNPLRLCKRALHLRVKTKGIRQEFFGL
jgi:exopolysaccharide biosynthesis galactosyltransferase PssJ